MATISWKAAQSGDWAVGALWAGNIAPGLTDNAVIAAAGAYLVTIAGGETITVATLALSAGTLALAGNLTAQGTISVAAGTTLDGGTTASAEGVIAGPNSLLFNNGSVIADAASATLRLNTATITNQGLLAARNGAILFLTSNSFTNLVGGVLTGGTYEADDQAAIDFAPGPFDFVHNTQPLSAITVDAATITLSGSSSTIFGFDPNAASNYDALDASLTSITAAGVLNILRGHNFNAANTLTNDGVLRLGGGTLAAAALIGRAGSTLIGFGTVATALANAGVVEAQGGTLNLAGGLTGGALRTDAAAALALTGTYAQPIANAGTIVATSGTLRLTGGVTGSGRFVITGGAQQGNGGILNGPTTTLDLSGTIAGDVQFNGAAAALKLRAPGSFGGRIVGFGAGDTLSLTGIVATGATLSAGSLILTNGATQVGTLTLAGAYSGANFSAVPDGAGGTTVTVSGADPQDFLLEGQRWQSRVITWSFAKFNYGTTFAAAHPFSSLIDLATQAAAASVIELALSRWSRIAGLSFVQVDESSDPSAAANIRIGWGNLVSGGGGEIGQAAYQFIGTSFSGGTIVRLQDPALTSLNSTPNVIGGLTYASFTSTLYQVAVHEIGHAIGLDHSTDPAAVMFPTATGVQNQDANASDSAGLTALYADAAIQPNEVSVIGGTGDLVRTTFADTTEAAPAAIAVAGLNAGVLAGTVVSFTTSGSATIPAVAAGKTGLLLAHSGAVLALPLGYAAFATDATTPVTVTGGPSGGQIVVAGSGGLAFNAGLGAGSVFAAGGNNLISVYPGAGGQFIQTGSGNDTVVLLGADDTVNAGTGSNQILTGRGADIVNSQGADLIAAGDIGAVTINAAANDPVAFFGPGTSVFNAGSGHATVVSTVGLATVNSHGGTQIWLGSNRDVVNVTGADTIIGATGLATVNASAGNSFIFAGSGALSWTGGSGTSTVLGNASGSATLQGGSGGLVALSYAATRYSGGTGSATIAGFGGSLTINGGAGGGLFLGGPAGGNVITGGATPSILLGSGPGDVLTAGTSAGDVIQAGAGAETINALGTPGAHKIYAGSGPDRIVLGSGSTNVLTSTGSATIVAGSGLELFAFAIGNHPTVTVQGFSASTDFLSFVGFPANEKTTALAGATNPGAGELLTLSDGTKILLQGFSGLSAANLL